MKYTKEQKEQFIEMLENNWAELYVKVQVSEEICLNLNEEIGIKAAIIEFIKNLD